MLRECRCHDKWKCGGLHAWEVSKCRRSAVACSGFICRSGGSSGNFASLFSFWNDFKCTLGRCKVSRCFLRLIFYCICLLLAPVHGLFVSSHGGFKWQGLFDPELKSVVEERNDRVLVSSSSPMMLVDWRFAFWIWVFKHLLRAIFVLCNAGPGRPRQE